MSKSLNKQSPIVEKLLRAFIIHGDLSEYNLVYHDGRLFVIDFPQAVDLSSRVDRSAKFESGKDLLLRDLRKLESGSRDMESSWIQRENMTGSQAGSKANTSR